MPGLPQPPIDGFTSYSDVEKFVATAMFRYWNKRVPNSRQADDFDVYSGIVTDTEGGEMQTPIQLAESFRRS